MTFEPLPPDRPASGSSAKPAGPASPRRTSWPTAFDDPQAADVRAGWEALDGLLRPHAPAAIDDVEAAELVRRVRRRVLRRRVGRWSAGVAMAAACAVALFGAWRFVGPSWSSGGHGPDERIAAVGSAAANPRAFVAGPSATAEPGMVGALVEVVPPADDAFPAGPWIDPLADDLEAIQSQAFDVEIGWQARSDRLTDLRRRFEEVQSSWNEGSL